MGIMPISVRSKFGIIILSKDRAYKMWDALTGLFQSSNENRKMVLREKLKSIKMAKEEVVISYLTRISQVRDVLAAVRLFLMQS